MPADAMITGARARRLLLLGVLFLGCDPGEVIVEPVGHATYFVVNGGAESIVFAASPRGRDPIRVEVAPGMTREVDRVTEGSGGHTFPSNFYESYSVEQQGVVATREIDDRDWLECAGGVLDERERMELCLFIEDGDFQ